jgi:hypothetical protein
MIPVFSYWIGSNPPLVETSVFLLSFLSFIEPFITYLLHGGLVGILSVLIEGVSGVFLSVSVIDHRQEPHHHQSGETRS